MLKTRVKSAVKLNLCTIFILCLCPHVFAEIPIESESIENFFSIAKQLDAIEKKYPELAKDLEKISIFDDNGEKTATIIQKSPAYKEISLLLEEHKFASIQDYTDLASRLIPAYLAATTDIATQEKMLNAQMRSMNQQKALLKESGAPIAMIKELEKAQSTQGKILEAAKKSSQEDIAAARKFSKIIKENIDNEQ